MDLTFKNPDIRGRSDLLNPSHSPDLNLFRINMALVIKTQIEAF